MNGNHENLCFKTESIFCVSYLFKNTHYTVHLQEFAVPSDILLEPLPIKVLVDLDGLHFLDKRAWTLATPEWLSLCLIWDLMKVTPLLYPPRWDNIQRSTPQCIFMTRVYHSDQKGFTLESTHAPAVQGSSTNISPFVLKIPSPTCLAELNFFFFFFTAWHARAESKYECFLFFPRGWVMLVHRPVLHSAPK